jgi:hypothetical protein
MIEISNPVVGALSRHVTRKLATYVWILAGGLCFTGCAGYQLGTGTQPKFTTLFIAPVTTEVLIPQARELVTTQLREAFLKDSRVKLVGSPAEAETVLLLSLIGFDRTVAVSRQDDTGLARRFDVSLRAQATLTDQRTQQVLFAQRPLTAKRGVFTDSGLVPAEYQALSLLAEQLASEAAHAVLDTW